MEKKINVFSEKGFDVKDQNLENRDTSGKNNNFIFDFLKSEMKKLPSKTTVEAIQKYPEVVWVFTRDKLIPQ